MPRSAALARPADNCVGIARKAPEDWVHTPFGRQQGLGVAPLYGMHAFLLGHPPISRASVPCDYSYAHHSGLRNTGRPMAHGGNAVRRRRRVDRHLRLRSAPVRPLPFGDSLHAAPARGRQKTYSGRLQRHLRVFQAVLGVALVHSPIVGLTCSQPAAPRRPRNAYSPQTALWAIAPAVR
jgi:hypothetical protein